MMLCFSLYNYKVFCTQYHNRALLQFGNCDPRYTEGIIASNRSILLPELDARLNDSVCNGKLHVWIMKLLIILNCPKILFKRFQAGIIVTFIKFKL